MVPQSPEALARQEIDELLTRAGWLVVDGREDLDEFVKLYNPAKRHVRKATWSAEAPEGRWRVYEYDELMARDKASPDIFWLRDDSLADSDNQPAPEVIAQEIIDDLGAALEQFRLIAADAGAGPGDGDPAPG